MKLSVKSTVDPSTYSCSPGPRGPDARDLEDVVVLMFLVQRKRVLEAGTTAPLDADAKADVALGALARKDSCTFSAAMSVS